MSDKVDKLSDKIDIIGTDVSEIKTDMAVMRVDVNHHIKRSDQHEETLKFFYEELKPIKIYVSKIQGLVQFIAIMGGVTTFVFTLMKLMGKI